jgi:hypothetical protein
VTELCSGQALGDADNEADTDADNNTADKSNPYMSPFQGDTKIAHNMNFMSFCFLFNYRMKLINIKCLLGRTESISIPSFFFEKAGNNKRSE